MKGNVVNINIENIIVDIKHMEAKLQKPRYCIMSSDTLKTIEKECGINNPINFDSKFYNTIYGIKIAVCDSLEFGEFELI